MANLFDPLKPDIETLLMAYRDNWTTRQGEHQMYWDFYLGRHARYMKQWKGEGNDDYAERVRDAIVENHCKSTVDINVGYLYGEQPIRQVQIKDEQGIWKEYKEGQNILDQRIWNPEFNDMEDFMSDVALMAGVTGFAVVRNNFINMETGLPFDLNASNAIIKANATIEYELYDSTIIMPIPYIDKQTKKIFPRKLGGYIIMYDSDSFSGNAIFDRLRGAILNQYDVIEYVDNEVYLRWVSENKSEKFVQQTVFAGTNYENKNPFKNVNTIFSLFVNPGDPMILEGEPDHIDGIPLNRALNETLNDDRNAISFHSFPILLLYGAKLPENFRRTASSTLEFDNIDQKAEYLVWDDDLEASDKIQTKYRENISRVTKVSDLSRGNASNIGQIRGASGLKTLFRADYINIKRKQKKFAKGERNMMKSALQMYGYYTKTSLKPFRSEVKFKEDFLGIDELMKAEITAMQQKAGVVLPEDIIRENYDDLKTEAQVKAKLQEIEKARHKVEERMERIKPPISQVPDKKVEQQQKADKKVLDK